MITEDQATHLLSLIEGVSPEVLLARIAYGRSCVGKSYKTSMKLMNGETKELNGVVKLIPYPSLVYNGGSDASWYLPTRRHYEWVESE